MTQQYCLASMLPSYPTTISSLTSPPSISPQSTEPSPWNWSTVSELQLPAAVPSRGPAFLSGMYGYGKECLILIPFRLPQISCFTLSLKCFSSDSDNCPAVGIRPLLQFPHLLRVGPVLLILLFLPPSFFVLPNFSWFYILFSTGQVILSALSWCSACTSVSEGVFLMYPWREMYSASTYSSAILSGCTVFITATQICGR